jgi:hypothetical protein
MQSRSKVKSSEGMDIDAAHVSGEYTYPVKEARRLNSTKEFTLVLKQTQPEIHELKYTVPSGNVQIASAYSI